MTAINIGPFALPVRPLLLALALVASIVILRWKARSDADRAEPVLWWALGLGLVAARIAFVATHFSHYRGSIAGMLDIRDGGFTTLVGLIVVLAVIGWQAWRLRPQRGALMLAASGGIAVWIAGLVAALLLHGGPQSLPDVTLTSLDGKPVALRSLAGKPVVINMWATWCPPCRREMPALGAAQAQHKDIVFVFANQGQAPDPVRSYLDDQGLALQNVLLDPEMKMGAAAGSQALPTTLFFDAAGRLVERRIGGLSEATLADKLARLEK